jgi:hypothetical protein
MKFLEHYLQEMILLGNKPKDKHLVIAFNKWIWVLDSDQNTSELKRDILSKLELEDEIEILDDEFEKEDDYDFITSIQEKISDVLAGQIQGKTLYLYDYGSVKQDPKSSILVKKVVQALKLNSSSYIEDLDSTETKVSKKKMIGNVGDLAYHGTSSKYLDNILKFGLKAGEADSNYSQAGIYHPDLLFFSTRIGEAMHHAIHTASKVNGNAIIIAFKIPDKDQIIADYDIEKLTRSDKYYTDMGKYNDSQSYIKDPDKLSKIFGVYGYKKRIPASFISHVYVGTKPVDDLYAITDFKKMKPKTALKTIELGYYDF